MKKIILTVLSLCQITTVFLPWFIILRTENVAFFSISNDSGTIYGNYLPGGWLSILVSVIGLVLVYRKSSLFYLTTWINFFIAMVYLLNIIDPNWLASKPFYGDVIKLYGLYIFFIFNLLFFMVNLIFWKKDNELVKMRIGG